MLECEGCGAHVTRAFARVFGDNNDDVVECLTCSTTRDLSDRGGVVR